MAGKPSLSFTGQVRSLSANFWYANIIEMFERLAFFGVRAITSLYLVETAARNGLGLDYIEKGNIYFWWALVQCLVPMVSGGYSDRYGYRRSLAVAFSLNIIGYLGMAQAGPIADLLTIRCGWVGAGYWVFLAAALVLATGTAIFKPPVQGTVARSVTEETSSMGFGIFYWLVNIGGAIAPMAAAQLRGEINWHYVFYAAAAVTAFNFIPTFLLYREPDKGPVDRSRGPVTTFASSILHIFKNPRLLAFLLIFSCFWLMFMQLWDLLPNFVDEWVDTSDAARLFGAVNSGWILATGQTKPEMIININAFSIILLVLVISWLIRKLNKIAAMVVGMIVSLIGFVGSGATYVGLFCCLMIFVFSVGEMICSPTFGAYIGLIAPPDKKALYMGYSNIPFAIGWAVGNKISGVLYERMASKFNLARQYLVERLGMDAAAVMDKTRMTNEQVMETLARSLNGGQGTVRDATQVLWDLHHPYVIWHYLGAIGLAGIVGMIVFYLVTKEPPREGAQRLGS